MGSDQPRRITASIRQPIKCQELCGNCSNEGESVPKALVMEGETAPIPNVRAKLDELFIHWLSKASTQDFLQQELKRVLSREERPKTVATLSSDTLSTPVESLTPSPPPPPPELHCNASPSPPPVQSSRSHSSKKKRHNQLALKSTKQALTDANEQTVQGAKADGSKGSITIPPFYFPYGRPEASTESRDRVLKEAHKRFKACGREGVSKEEFGTVVKVRRRLDAGSGGRRGGVPGSKPVPICHVAFSTATACSRCPNMG